MPNSFLHGCRDVFAHPFGAVHHHRALFLKKLTSHLPFPRLATLPSGRKIDEEGNSYAVCKARE